MLTLTDLRCEYAVNPLGLDVIPPRFSWVLKHPERGQKQSAWQVRVASSAEALAAGQADIWDSGKVASAQSVGVEYGGRPLSSRERCYWTARAWDLGDSPSPWAEPAWFEMGLLSPADWTAKWVGFPAGLTGRALLFRCAFAVDRPVRRARAYIAGLGYHELRLNGRKVDDRVLDPATTAYATRVLYTTYDIEPLLRQGANVAGVIVGNGWYGARILLAQLRFDFADGSAMRIDTGLPGSRGARHTWQVSGAPIVSHGIYDGEIYDARLEKDGWDTPEGKAAPNLERTEKWVMPVETEGPGGRLVSQALEPIRVVETLRPKTINSPSPGVYVFDMGQNMAGWARLRVRGERGARVILRFAETLKADGRVDQENLRLARATDEYIPRGDGLEEWEPRFTYHGFRYVQVEGFPGEPSLDAIQGRVVRSAVEPTGQFECGDALLNQIQKNVWWTEAGNLHGIPTDCPQREERMGWLNDMTARAEESVYNFGMARFFAKWLADVEDAQDPATGAITETAPSRWGRFPADPVCISNILTAWFLYLHYGDTRVLSGRFDSMKRWVDYLTTRAEDDIVDYGAIGDWAPPVKFGLNGRGALSVHTPQALMATGCYYYGARLLSQIAGVLGKDVERAAYAALAQRVGEAYNRKFWDEAAGGYASNNQACNAFSLFVGLVSEPRKPRVVQNLSRDVMEENDGHLSTGNICTKHLLEVLAREGRVDVAWRLATQTTYPSWGYMISLGATTVWERWEHMTGGGMNSHNHPMLGSISSWFYKYLAGVTVDEERPAFERFHVRPLLAGDLTRASARLKTVRGLAESAWERDGDRVTLRVTVPVNSEARVSVPAPRGANACRVSEGGQAVWRKGAPADAAAGVAEAKGEERFVTFLVGSGKYVFTCEPE